VLGVPLITVPDRYGQSGTRPPPPHSTDAISHALSGLILAPRARRERRGLAPPFEADKIRRQIAIHMGPNPSYDNLSAFFASYAKHSALYSVETMSYYGSSIISTHVFPPQLCHAPTVIIALVVHDHLPTFDDLEFVLMVDGRGDLIFNALCTDSNSYLSPPKSSEEEPSSGQENKDRPTAVLRTQG
jgi:hypothetical protein